MQFTAQTYLQLYNKLNHPDSNQSKQANKLLLQLQNTEVAFKVAIDLMGSQQYHIHGAQLLSKKLNNPIPKSISIKELLFYLLKYPKKSDLIYCCIAKIFLHMGIYDLPPEIQLSISSNETNQPYAIFLLRTFKEMPSVVPIIIVQSYNQSKAKSKQLKNLLFEKCKPLMIQNFKKYRQLVIGCLESQISMHGLLNSPELLGLLLQQDLQTSSSLLQQVLQNQSYPQMNEQIWNYLISHEKQSQLQVFFPTYLSFCRSICETFLKMKDEQLFLNILSKILQVMRQDANKTEDMSHHYIADTFQFWFKLIHQFKKMKKQNVPKNHQTIMCQAIVQIWAIVVKASKKKQFSPKLSKPQNNVIDLQDDQSLNINSDALSHLIPDNGNRFRLTAQDFFTLCFDLALELQETLIKEVLKTFYSKINDYCITNDPLDLELAIYVMQSLAQIPMAVQNPHNELYQAQILKNIMKRQQLLNFQLCQKLINLMGRIQKIIDENIQILCAVLDFIKKALSFDQLSCVAAQNFCSILMSFKYDSETIDKSKGHEKHIEGFLNQIYDKIYGNTKDVLVLQQLTKSLLAFIFKFRDNKQSYKAFLLTFNQKINQDSLSVKQKCRYLECLLSSSMWLIIQGIMKNTDYLIVLSQYITNQRNMVYLLTNTQNSKSKTQLAASVRIITLAIKVVGGLNVKIWLQFIVELVKKMLNNQSQMYGNILNPLTCLMDLEEVAKDPQDMKDVIQFLQTYETQITSYLIKSETVNYNLTKSCLKMHQIIMNKYVPKYSVYNPQQITIFVSQKIMKNSDLTEYQILREAFAYFILLIRKNYALQLILQSCLKSHRRTADGLWRNFETVVLEIYNKQKQPLFLKVFSIVKPELLPPNPLWKVFIDGLGNNDSKVVKNILLCLS